jgi:hypothetical protein
MPLMLFLMRTSLLSFERTESAELYTVIVELDLFIILILMPPHLITGMPLKP